MNDKIDILTRAIHTKTPISFEYIKEKKVTWVRVWNPHAIYIFTSKSWEKSIKIHIVQTAWVSDSKEEKPFPEFRQFDVENIERIVLIKEKSPFKIDSKYNSDWEWYNDHISKI